MERIKKLLPYQAPLAELTEVNLEHNFMSPTGEDFDEIVEYDGFE